VKREDRGRGLFDGSGSLLGLETNGSCNGVQLFGAGESTALQNELGRKREGEEDTDLEERDHHVREEEEVGDIEMRQRRSE
jgi:cation transport regulator ChaC